MDGLFCDTHRANASAEAAAVAAHDDVVRIEEKATRIARVARAERSRPVAAI